MHALKNWEARRSGGAITVTGECTASGQTVKLGGIAAIEAERAQLARERVVAENQLTAARMAMREGEARSIGRRIQTLDQRAGVLGRRLKALNRSRREFAFHDAVKAIVDGRTWHRILEEQERLLNEAAAGLASADGAE